MLKVEILTGEPEISKLFFVTIVMVMGLPSPYDRSENARRALGNAIRICEV